MTVELRRGLRRITLAGDEHRFGPARPHCEHRAEFAVAPGPGGHFRIHRELAGFHVPSIPKSLASFFDGGSATTMKRILLAMLLAGTVTAAQTVTLEYRVKAAYLHNFVRYVEWPADVLGRDMPLNLCVAGRNPFGTMLNDLLEGEEVGGRPVVVRVILEPEPGCHVVFIPRGAAMPAYMRAVAGMSVLTIGETPEFTKAGGIITFVLEGDDLRFEINQDAAARAQLQVSSRLLRLARPASTRSGG